MKPTKDPVQVRALALAERALKAYPGPEARYIIRTMETRARHAGSRQAVKQRRSPKPKGKDPAKAKKALHAECEALCKALVFHRDCGAWDARDGYCITCMKHTTLQWGHFMERQKAPGLRYSVTATAGQCGQCNGPGKGMPWEFQAAIDTREYVGIAKEMIEKFYKKPWTWNKATLTGEREKLIRLCAEKRIPVEQVLKTPPSERSELPKGASPVGSNPNPLSVSPKLPTPKETQP